MDEEDVLLYTVDSVVIPLVASFGVEVVFDEGEEVLDVGEVVLDVVEVDLVYFLVQEVEGMVHRNGVFSS